MKSDGWNVAIEARTQLDIPPSCASCGGEPQRHLVLQKGGLWASIPYCGRCAGRAHNPPPRAFHLFAGSALVAVAVAAVLAEVARLPAPFIFVVPAVLTLAATYALWVFVALRPPRGATTAWLAVRIVSADFRGATFFCSNRAWAEAFAQRNGGSLEPAQITEPLRAWSVAVVPGLILAPAVSYFAWDHANPMVFLDNGAASPVQVWIDGEPAEIVPPAGGETGRAAVRASRGRHVFGHSRVGAAAPEKTLEAEIHGDRRHLYNPGKMSCHWLSAVIYTVGSTTRLNPLDTRSVPSHLQGPLPIEEFYDIKDVDHWLEEAPGSIEMRSGDKSYRIVLLRNLPCLELARRGCPPEVLNELVACEDAASSEDDVAGCIHEANEACRHTPQPMQL